MALMLGVDVGGTKVAAGLVDARGHLVGEAVVRPTVTRDALPFVDDLLVTARKALKTAPEEVVGVGVACAGTVDQAQGIVITSPHLPLRNYALREKVEQALALPVVFENDVNAAVWAESRVGVAAGLTHVVMITLGSGVGGGLLLDGRIYRGADGAAGELGHVLIEPHGELCRCGARGCLETALSAKALERIAFRTVGLFERGAFTGEKLGPLARDGELSARTALKEYGWWLGLGCANIANVFNPEMIVVGGGLGNLGDLILGHAREVVAERALPPARDRVRVEQAALGGHAGFMGAALLAWQDFDMPNK